MATNRVWVLGAADPEMLRIEALLRECGEEVAYAVIAGGERVRPGEAYRALLAGPIEAGEVIEVECAVADRSLLRAERATTVDHHRRGDPGWGVEPADFMRGSSLGQVISRLGQLYGSELGPLGRWGKARLAECPEAGALAYESGRWHVGVRGTGHGSDGLDDGYHCVGTGYCRWTCVPDDLVIAAAADHCLPAAYRGECPGVDPDELMRWRAESRAAFQRRSVEEVLRDAEAAMAAIQAAPEIELSAGAGRVTARDLRGRHVPELPEAAARLGIGFVADGQDQPDGRTKVILQSASPEQLSAWPAWAERQGLVDLYGGDPERGFAGGYLPVGR